MTINYFEDTHPNEDSDVIVSFNEDLKLENVVYSDDKSDVNLNEELKIYFQKLILNYVEN